MEAVLLQQCQGHRNIITLHQSYRSKNGRVYLVLEFLPVVLSSVISKHEAVGLPPRQVLHVLKQLLQATSYLHKNKVRECS